MTISLSIKPFTVMAGLDPAIHGAARKVRLSGRWYDLHATGQNSADTLFAASSLPSVV